MHYPRLLALLLLIAIATPGCTTMNRVGDSIGNFFGQKKAEETQPRSRPKPAQDTPPTLESTPQEYVGS
jgi:predicted small secreted protein